MLPGAGRAGNFLSPRPNERGPLLFGWDGTPIRSVAEDDKREYVDEGFQIIEVVVVECTLFELAGMQHVNGLEEPSTLKFEIGTLSTSQKERELTIV